MPRTFTKTVAIPQRNANDVPLYAAYAEDGTPQGAPLVQRELGAFTFRLPTISEQRNIEVRIAHDTSQIENPQRMPWKTFMLIVACAHFPYQIEKAPDGFVWESVTYEEARAIYEAYQEGEQEATGTKNSEQ